MRTFAVIALTGLALAACGAEAGKAAPTPDAAAPVGAIADAAPAAFVALGEADRRRVCLAGMAAIHGQTIDAAGFEGETVGAVRVDGTEGEVISLSWPAPVDGGRRFADCRIDGDMIQWRPTRPRSGGIGAWMTGSTDPVIRFVLEGDKVRITQTFPDGTKTHSQLSSTAAREQG